MGGGVRSGGEGVMTGRGRWARSGDVSVRTDAIDSAWRVAEMQRQPPTSSLSTAVVVLRLSSGERAALVGGAGTQKVSLSCESIHTPICTQAWKHGPATRAVSHATAQGGCAPTTRRRHAQHASCALILHPPALTCLVPHCPTRVYRSVLPRLRATHTAGVGIAFRAPRA